MQWVAVAQPWRAGRPAGAQEPPSPTVLARAAAYVAEFHRQLSDRRRRALRPGRSIVAERRARAARLRRRASRAEVRSAAGEAGRRRRVDAVSRRVRGRRRAGPRPDGAADAAVSRTGRRRSTRRSQHPRRERALQHRRHPAERQHAGLPLLFLEAANQSRFKFKQTNDRRPRDRAGEPGARRRVPRLDRGVGDRVRGERSRAR